MLEVGCGTGAILSELPAHLSINGLDIDPVGLKQCLINAPIVPLVEGNALQLPYANNSFDVVYCHYLLLWVRDPLQALLEMKRVTKPGGNIIAFAEPDYTARIDKPEELVQLGKWQTEIAKKAGRRPGLRGAIGGILFSGGDRDH